MKVILADLQDITKAGIRYYINILKEDVEICEVDNKNHLVTELQKGNDAIVILDHTNFDFEEADDILIVVERFPESQWMFFSPELDEQQDQLLNEGQ